MRALRIVSLIEGTSVTGPIKALLAFVKEIARVPDGAHPVVHSLIVTARPSAQGRVGNDLITALHELGVELDVAIERHAWDPRVIPQIVKFIRARQPDIVETHQVKSHFLLASGLWWGGLRRDFRWLAYHHGYTRTSLKVSLYQQLDRWTLPRTDGVITVCRPFAEQLVRRGVQRERLEVIANSVERRSAPAAQELAALRDALRLGVQDRAIVSVGRLSTEKGHRDLIAAFATLLEAHPAGRLRLILVGDGPERAALENQAAPCRDRIHFAGQQLDPWNWFFLADVFALPSHSEGSPLVLLEAMAAGRAIVATRVGGVAETVVDGESALLVPREDPPALAAAIQCLLNDDELRRRLESQALASVERFSPGQYRTRLLGIYEAVLAGQ